MNLFRLPKTLISELHKISARFWWGGSASIRKLHWFTWENLCKPKWEGGLGFCDLGAFNQAMLAKQCWRIIHNPNSLISRVLKGCYFSDTSFLDAKSNMVGSFLWKSLVWGRELIVRGSRWRIGNGRSVQVYKDRWIPRESTFKIFSPLVQHGNRHVASLKLPDGSWNVELIE